MFWRNKAKAQINKGNVFSCWVDFCYKRTGFRQWLFGNNWYENVYLCEISESKGDLYE
jgi:hypothetical protein